MRFALAFEEFPKGGRNLRYANVPWDTAIFGLPVYELACEAKDPGDLASPLDRLLSVLAGDRATLVYTKVSTERVALVRLLVARGFYPVETTVELSLPLARLQPIAPERTDPIRLRPANKDDLPGLVALARRAFWADRFHLDTNLPPGKADERYAFWIEDGLRHGDLVFVYEDPRGPSVLGFAQLRLTAPRAVHLSLAAVAPAFWGTGIGPLMYQAILKECRAKDSLVATARISMNNLDIVNLLARLGFVFRKADITLHWYRAAPQGGSSVERT